MLPMNLGGNRWALSAAPLQMQAYWQEWVGSIRSNAIRDANLWLIAKNPSAAPEIDNDENVALRQEADRILHSLLLVTPIYYEQAYILGGANVRGVSGLRQFGDLIPSFRLTPETPRAGLSVQHFARVPAVMQGLEEMFRNPDYRRARAGVIVFLRALQNEFVDGRLHQFVRSLEGIAKPEIGRSKKQFVHRCCTFTGHTRDSVIMFEESYDVRSQVEHLNLGVDALSHLPEDQRQARLGALTRRMEVLCRDVYGRLCTSPPHLRLFSDGAIDTFWKSPDHERVRLWGI